MDKIYLVLEDQYMKQDGSFTATYSDTTTVAAFSSYEKACPFIDAQPHRNQFGPLYWRVKVLPVDVEKGEV